MDFENLLSDKNNCYESDSSIFLKETSDQLHADYDEVEQEEKKAFLTFDDDEKPITMKSSSPFRKIQFAQEDASPENVNTSQNDCIPCKDNCTCNRILSRLNDDIGHPPPLQNLGDTCYLNAILQVLLQICPQHVAEDFANLNASFSMDNKEDEFYFSYLIVKFVVTNFRHRISDANICNNLTLKDVPDSVVPNDKFAFFRDTSLSASEDLLKITNLLKCGTGLLSLFGPGQHDAHELLKLILNNLEKLFTLHPSGIYSESVRTFAIESKATVTCLKCGHFSKNIQHNTDLCVPIIQAATLEAMIEQSYSDELLSGSNQYLCENCACYVDAMRKTTILGLPNILLIQLKLFQWDGEQQLKIMFHGDVPNILDMSSLTCTSLGLFSDCSRKYSYSLKAVVSHAGQSLHRGHYLSFVKSWYTERWYKCDDSIINCLDSLPSSNFPLSDCMQNTTPYLLFYERINSESSNSK